ncbi:MAG: WXG100 family type VII secretion target [Ilumatobacter sp.]
MSGIFSATPDDLHAIGTKLEAQVAIIDTIIGDVNSQLGNTAWTGPARDSFEEQWNNSFVPALRNLNEAFTGTGKQCHTRAENTIVALG